MHVSVSDCPSEATLRAIGQMSPEAAVYRHLEDHVQECPACLATLERVVKEWTVGTAQGVPSRSQPPEQLPDVAGFVVERELGRGGMAVVYLAWHLPLQRHVALKLVAGGPLTGDRERRHWLREAQAHSRVRHPDVVQIFDVVETGDYLFLVLEYVLGGSLEQRLATGPLSPQDAARLTQSIALAVEAIHQQGLLHLDLKPSNILLDAEPGAPWSMISPKVSDFGVAHWEGNSLATGSHSGALRGTPSYMAPEQVTLRREELRPAADVYALGAMLYELLTGRPPFQAPTDVEVLDMVRKQEPVPPGRLNARIPRDLETICLKCLQKAPAARYASVEALAADLGRWLAGDPIKARAVSPFERAWRWCRQRPAIALLASTLAVTVIASVVGLSTLLRRAVVERNHAVAARVRAQNKEQIASKALRQIVNTIDKKNLGNRIEAEKLEVFVQNVRRTFHDLKDPSEADEGFLLSLATLDRILVWTLAETTDRNAEARQLITESISLLRDCVRRQPGDEVLRSQLVESLKAAGVVSFHNKDFDGGLRLLHEASTLALSLKSDSIRLAQIRRISEDRRFEAYRQLRLGHRREAERLLDADLRMFDSLTSGDAAQVEPKLLKAQILALRNPKEDGLSLVLSTIPTQGALPADQKLYVTEWLALEADRLLFDPGGTSSAPTPEELDDLAETVVESIRLRCAALSLPETLVPMTGFQVSQLVHPASAAMRKEGRQKEARWVEERFLPFARQLVRQYPRDTDAYMTMSEAHIQTSKNAWRLDDEARAVQALREALAAAFKAASLDPTRADAHRLLDDRKRRLARATEP